MLSRPPGGTHRGGGAYETGRNGSRSTGRVQIGPAVLNKDVLGQAEVLITLRMTSPRDVAAIDEWIRLYADTDQATELRRSLPSLPVGTAWIWSPGWLERLDRVTIRPRKTFDSSATPKPGTVQRRPRLATVDVARLRDQMAAGPNSPAASGGRGPAATAAAARIHELEATIRDLRDRPVQVEVHEIPVFDTATRAQIAGSASRSIPWPPPCSSCAPP